MAKRIVSCSFFLVDPVEGQSQTFDQVLDEIYRVKPTTAQRTISIPEGYARLSGWKTHKGFKCGMLLRIRNDKTSQVAALATEDMKALHEYLNPGEYPTEWFSFCYFPEYQVLGVHRNLYAGGHRRLQDYIAALVGKEVLTFTVTAAASAVERFRQWGILHSTEVRISVPEFAPGEGEAVSLHDRLVQMGQQAGAKEISITLTKGRYKKPLAARAKELISELLSTAGDEVVSAHATGKPNALAEELTLDLLEESIREKVTIDTSGTPEPEDFYDAVQIGYTKRLDEFQRQYHDRKK